MSQFVVLIDACALVPISLTDTLLHCASAYLYRLRWSEDILREVERALVGDLRLAEDKARRRVEGMKKAFPEASIAGYEDLIASVHPRDDGDRHVLAAAVHAQAQVIVTMKLRDFPPASVSPYNIEVQHPDVFLTDLYDLAPEVVATLIRSQAEALKRPPMTHGRVLDTLAQHVPVFAESVRKHLQDADTLDDTSTDTPEEGMGSSRPSSHD